MSAAARILDANLNRAREALRVMEDIARFALNDAALSGELKAIRHDLREAVETLMPGWLEANRDTPGDVGTSLKTQAELSRSSLADVAIAAGKRAGEAFRTTEEVGKTISAGFAQRIEALRYRIYTAESKLQLQLGRMQARQWRVCVLLTQSLCTLPWRETLRSAIEGGADCIQVREKDMATRDLVQHVRAVIELARPLNVSVIVNDRVDVALAAGADGVHVGQDDLPIRDVRTVAGRALLVGVSTHNLAEADAAIREGADYCGVGAMFASSLKPDRMPSGPAYLRQFVQHYPNVPHLAIRGVSINNIDQLISAGVRGVAVSSAVCKAHDPAAVVRALRIALEHADQPAERA